MCSWLPAHDLREELEAVAVAALLACYVPRLIRPAVRELRWLPTTDGPGTVEEEDLMSWSWVVLDNTAKGSHGQS